MHSQSTTRPGAIYKAIAAALESANPREGFADTGNAELAVEVAAYVADTYHDAAAGLLALADILRDAAKAVR